MLNNYEEIWDKCLVIIKDNVNAQTYATWFSPIKPVAMEPNLLTIQVPSQFFYEWLEEHYVSLIGKALRNVTGAPCKLNYNIATEIDMSAATKPIVFNIPASGNAASNGKPLSASTQINPFIMPGLKKTVIDSMLNSRYTFDNYIGGDCNNLALSAGKAIAERPGTSSFNPIMIYGGVGLGKTHLIQAIGNKVVELFPDKQVIYIAAEKFASQFIESIRTNAQNDFINFYQSLDVLIIDDIQFLAGKEKTLEIFFHVFNHLHQQGKQIIITSDSPARDLKGIDERLLSRFKWGLTTDIKPPDLETRLAILRNRIANDGMNLSDEVVEYIAYNITHTIRDLEGALVTLLAKSYSENKEISLSIAKEILTDLVGVEAKQLTIPTIKKLVSAELKISIEDMEGKSRKREIVQARQIAMHLANHYTTCSLKTVGSYFGNRDHSTVIHSCRTVEDIIATDKRFKSMVDMLHNKIKVGSV